MRQVTDWPSPPGEPAFHGIAGVLVRSVEDQTEADPVAILAHLLVAFGNVVGRTAHRLVGATSHHTNEFALLVGPSAKGRKGTSWDLVERLLQEVDETWLGTRVGSGSVLW